MTKSSVSGSEPKYSIAVDFDGVIHSYTSRWVSADVIPDPPVPGAIDWLNEIGQKFRVIIFTTRGKTEEGRQAVRAYLREHGYQPAERHGLCVTEVTAEKPPALIYLDDRAVRFDGEHFPTADQIHREYVPWNKTRGALSPSSRPTKDQLECHVRDPEPVVTDEMAKVDDPEQARRERREWVATTRERKRRERRGLSPSSRTEGESE